MKMIIFLIGIVATITFATGCATGPQLITNDAYNYKISRVFNSDFESTWSTIIKVMEAYPITTIEKDSGILLTDWVQGSSPLYLRKIFIPLAQRETKKAIGIYPSQLTPNVVYIVHALEKGPAYESGIRSQDVVLSCSQKKVTKVSELVDCIAGSEKVTLTTLRYGAYEPLEFEIKPKKIKFGYAYNPVKTRYKLNIRVSKVAQERTEVKVINYEEADFGYQTRYGWHSDYQVIKTATLREKILLDKIESEIKNIFLQK